MTEKISKWNKQSATEMLREKQAKEQAVKIEYERPKLLIQGQTFPIYMLDYKMNYLYTSALYQHEWNIELHQFRAFDLIQLSSPVTLEVMGVYHKLEIVGFQLKGTFNLSLHLRPANEAQS